MRGGDGPEPLMEPRLAASVMIASAARAMRGAHTAGRGPCPERGIADAIGTDGVVAVAEKGPSQKKKGRGKRSHPLPRLQRGRERGIADAVILACSASMSAAAPTNWAASSSCAGWQDQ